MLSSINLLIGNRWKEALLLEKILFSIVSRKNVFLIHQDIHRNRAQITENNIHKNV